MDTDTVEWEQELERRILVYEQIEATGALPGRLTGIDYLALAALTIVLSVGFWMWGH